MPTSEVYNMDCLEYMQSLPDNYFDLCIADPPYGISFGTFNRTNKTSDGVRFKANRYHNADWDDSIPSDMLFNELLRVSKDAIIWGGGTTSLYFGKMVAKALYFGIRSSRYLIFQMGN